MAVIEITKRGKKFQAQFRTDDGRIDKIAGSWETQQLAKRELLAWQAQVKRASIKVLPFAPLPPPPEPEEEESEEEEDIDDESLHAQGNGGETTDEDDDDDEEEEEDDGDSLYTVGELMEYLKSELVELADQYGVEGTGTKADIAQRIVDAQG